MILYLYAIAEGLPRVEEIGGVTGEPLKLLAVEGVDLVASDLAEAPPLDPQTLGAQDRIVRLLHARAAALLPMRFGAAFGSETELQRALAVRLPVLRERLIAVRGAEQMTLRVLRPQHAGGASEARAASAATATATPAPTGADPATPMTGVAYLRGRAAKGMPREIVPLLDAVHAQVRATRIEPGRAAGVIATVYQLVARGASQDYVAAVRAAAATMPDLAVRLSGPAPCYAFT